MNFHEKSSVVEHNYRRSGFLIAGMIALIYTMLLLRSNHQPLVLTGAAVTALAAWIEARLMRKTVDSLIHVGNIMHRFTNPAVLGLIYIAAVIPTAFVLKIIGKDVLQFQLDCKATTYWQARPADDIWKNSFRNQF